MLRWEPLLYIVNMAARRSLLLLGLVHIRRQPRACAPPTPHFECRAWVMIYFDTPPDNLVEVMFVCVGARVAQVCVCVCMSGSRLKVYVCAVRRARAGEHKHKRRRP